jgi:hypothetical protein
MGALVDLFVRRRDHGKKLALAALTPQSIAVMQIAGLMSVLAIYPLLELAT